MVLRRSGPKLRFIKRFDDAGIVSDRTFPLGRIRFCVRRNEETRNRNTVLAQAVTQRKATHARKLHIDHQATHGLQIRIGKSALSRFVGLTSVVVRTQQSRDSAAKG